MDPMEILLGQNRGASTMQGLADALRKRKEVAQLAILSGDPTSQKFGGSLYSDVEGQQNARLEQEKAEEQRKLTQGYYDQMKEGQGLDRALREKELEEMARYHRGMENAALAKAMAKNGGRPPPLGAQKTTMNTIELVDELKMLKDSYDPDYASKVGVFEGSLTNWRGKQPIIGTKGALEQSTWWDRYNLIYTLPERNRLFGSALTAPERQAWNSVNLSPNMSDAAIQEGIRRLTDIANRAMKKQFANDSSLYEGEWVYSMYGDHADELGFGQGEDPSQPNPLPAEGGGDETMQWGSMNNEYRTP